MKKILLILNLLVIFIANGQTPNNCNGAVPGCTTPSFGIQPNNPATNIVDFTTNNNISNPSTPPYGNNSGCLLSGETSSTFITISVVSSGTLQWSIIGLNPNGTPSGSGCFDWIMWPYTDASATCAGITGNTLAPVACNWNGTCNGNTGMSTPANYPPNASGTSYVAPLNVVAGQTYLLCLSNYSGTSQNVNLNFFGSASVDCNPTTPDQTICLGNSATVNILTPGMINPTFNWLVTTGVSNTTAGSNVTVTPTVTTVYSVEVTEPSSGIVQVVDFTITVVDPPQPNAGNDQNVCLGQVITLNGAVGSATNTSSWSTILPTGMTPAATANFSPNFSTLNPTVTVNQPGLYQFILRENNTVCGIIRDTVSVLVSELVQTVSKVDPSCGGYTDGQFIISSVQASEFSFDNGLTWQVSNTLGGFAAGTYTVCSRNTLGCQVCSQVTLIEPPTVAVLLSNDTLVCQNGTANLIAEGVNGTSFTYIWGHTNSSLANQTGSPIVNTYYDVIAVNENGCQSAPDSIYVTVRLPISGAITPTFSICPGYPQNITASATDGIGAPYNFVWSNGSNSAGATSTISANPASTMTYNVTITDGCESSPLLLSCEVVVLPLPEPQFSVLDSAICEPAVFVVTNTTDPLMVQSSAWAVSDGQTFINQNSFTTAAMWEGDYAVQLIVVSPAGCIDSLTIPDFLHSNPKPTAEFTWTPSPIYMFNTEVHFINQSIGGYSYEWSFQSGNPVSSILEDPISKFPDGEVGSYNAQLITTTEFGCQDTATYPVPVLPEVYIYAPNVFTPDGDEYNQTWSVIMAGIDFYDFNLKIFNRWGEIVWESNDISVKWDGTYNGEVLPDGTYTWVIRTKDSITDDIYNYNGHVVIIR